MSRIAIIGAGAWGTALAIALARKNTDGQPVHNIRLWAHESEVCQSITNHRMNETFLPGYAVPASVLATNRLEEALASADFVVSVMPSQHVRKLFDRMRLILPAQAILLSATKGLEEGSLARMTEVIADVLGSSPALRVGALSGPSFAIEVARGDPTAITVAAKDTTVAGAAQREFSGSSLRLYTNDDVIGVELGGALKNIIAIAAGICDGLGLGHNSVAALITRGLAEITRLVIACGGRAETMAGLAGLGDLVLTCTGGLSRNRTVGVELGRGRTLPDILTAMHGSVAEGVFSTAAAVGLARRHSIEMPITEQVHAILHEGKPARDAMQDLMSRRATSETGLYRS